MLAIADQANIDLEATLQYVTDGIEDNDMNKSILYGESLKGFKKWLDFYEIMKSKTPSTTKSSATSKGVSTSNDNKSNAKPETK